MIRELSSRYEHATHWMEVFSGGNRAAHLHVGLLIWLMACVILGSRLRDWRPILVLAAAEAINELVDRYSHGSWRWMDTTGDIVTTLFWPVTIVLLLRLLPRLRR